MYDAAADQHDAWTINGTRFLKHLDELAEELATGEPIELDSKCDPFEAFWVAPELVFWMGPCTSRSLEAIQELIVSTVESIEGSKSDQEREELASQMLTDAGIILSSLMIKSCCLFYSIIDGLDLPPGSIEGEHLDPPNETELCILGVLCECKIPLKGQQIADNCPSSYGIFNSNFKQNLSTLVKRGWVVSGGRGRASEGYRITELGKVAFLSDDAETERKTQE